MCNDSTRVLKRRTDRRSFLKGMLAGATLAALPQAAFAEQRGARLRWPTDRQLETTMTLRELAQAAGVELGCALTGWSMNDPVYGPKVRESIAREFTLATIEHGFYMSHLQPEPYGWDFATADDYVVWAGEHGLKRRGHALFYPGWATAEWVYRLADRHAMEMAIMEHVDYVLGRYDTLDEVVVVNEPYLAGQPQRDTDPFHRMLGDSYFSLAFASVYDASERVIAIYNDTLNHASEPGVNSITTELTRRNLDHLSSYGLLGDRFRLGLQVHLRAHALPDWDDMTRTIAGYREQFGCEVIVTEFDCDMSAIDDPDERAAWHARITEEALRAYLRADAGRSFSVWGIGDCFSWLEKDMGQLDADATLYTDAIEPKPAVERIKEVLRETSV